ncbi:MAG: MATE family efflux transporter [Oscillospiraceae bacterium]|jgi:putative MATE family efflux protein|nr:MATE family efflux transporter [Oscillospiraceae bacterium]
MFTKKALQRLILPLVVEQLLAVTIGMADTVMVSGVGEAAISGVSLVDSINILLIQIFSALATGGAVVVSQYIGSGNQKNACAAAKQLLYSITILSAGIMAFCLIFCNPILRLIFGNIDQDVLDYANIYFLLTASSYPFLAIYNAGAALYRSMGNSKVSMFTSLIMNIVNIGGNAILIYGCGWGTAGAGTATLVSRIVAAYIMLVLICRKNNLVYVDRLFHPEFDLSMVKRIFSIGAPNGLENGMFQIGKLIVQRLVTTFGTSAIAANAVAGSISSAANVPGNAISLGLITIVGQCVGAKDYDQSVYYTKRMIGLSYLSMGILNILLFFSAGPLVGLFRLDSAAAASCVEILQVFAFCSATIWVPSFVLPNTLRAAGDARFTMLTSAFSMWVFRIGFSYILAGAGFGLISVWYAMFIDWLFRSFIFIIRFRGGRWKTKRVI